MLFLDRLLHDKRAVSVIDLKIPLFVEYVPQQVIFVIASHHFIGELDEVLFEVESRVLVEVMILEDYVLVQELVKVTGLPQ